MKNRHLLDDLNEGVSRIRLHLEYGFVEKGVYEGLAKTPDPETRTDEWCVIMAGCHYPVKFIKKITLMP